MKKILFLSMLLLSMGVQADIATDTITLRTMDKITGRVQKVTLPIGEQTNLGPLTIFVEKCLKKPPEETPENAAFLTVMDEDIPGKPVFQGWMFSSNPALSAMEHPVYDIWVVDCGETPKQQPVEGDTSVSVEEQESNEPIED